MRNIRKKIHSILRKMEKHTKTDMIYLASGAFWTFIGNGLSSLSSLFLLFIFGNYISQSDYGTYQYILSVTGILGIPTLAGINTSITQATARGNEGVLKTGLAMRIRWGVLGAVASIMLAGYHFLNGNETLSTAFLITTIFLPLMDSFDVYGSFLEGKKLFKKSSLYSAVLNIIRTCALVVIILLTQNLFLIIFTFYISTTLLRAGFYYIVVKQFKPNSRIDTQSVSYGKHLSLMNILGNIASQFDKIILFHYLGAIHVAIYSFAAAPIARISGAITPITSFAFPKFTQTDPLTLKKTLPKKLLFLFLILSFITIIYIISAPFLFKLFLPNYSESILYSQVLAISLLFIPQKFLATTLTAHGQKKALYVITTVHPILKIVLLIILLPLIGIWGVVIATLAPLAVNGILANHFFKKM